MTARLFMLDTNSCIFLMRSASPELATKAQSVPLQHQVMSAETFAELTYGVQFPAAAKRKQNQAVLDSLALHQAVLDWRQEAALHYAEIRADLKKRGAQLGAADLTFAAHARALGAVIVTNNVKGFWRVKGLQVASWTK